MKRVLALDIATVSGWAADGDVRPDVPMIGSFDVGADESVTGKAFYTYEHALVKLIEKHQPQILAYEAPIDQRRDKAAVNSLTTSLKLLGLIAITQMLGYTYHLEIMPCRMQLVRKAFTGNGHATKSQIFQQCCFMRWPVSTHDESDAAAVWAFAHGKVKSEAYLEKVARSI